MNATTTPPPTKTAKSPAVVAKGAALAVRYIGRGEFDVSSGSEPGLVYVVAAPRGCRDPRRWSCQCSWSRTRGVLCSHVRAAAGELARLDRAAARQAVRS